VEGVYELERIGGHLRPAGYTMQGISEIPDLGALTSSSLAGRWIESLSLGRSQREQYQLRNEKVKHHDTVSVR
jgi:hypothetical protein